jgi:RNA methyltransferase, TrmH family
MVCVITSHHNSKSKLVRALQCRARQRCHAEVFLAEGIRLVEEAHAANWPFRFALYDEVLSERGRSLIEKLKSRGVECAMVSNSVMKSLSETESPQGVLAVLNRFRIPTPESLDFILILDQIRDPGNLGTLLRTAVGAGVQVAFLSPDTTDAFGTKAVRSGMGAHFRLPIHSLTWDEIKQQTQGVQVYLADMNGQSCWQTNLQTPLALIIGGEAGGASEHARELANGVIGIPMPGHAESLNAGVAGSILMLEVVRQRQPRISTATSTTTQRPMPTCDAT